MIINDNVELDYSDVLLLPNRSDIINQDKVNINRMFTPKHNPDKIMCRVPVIICGKITEGFEKTDVFFQNKMFVVISKHLNDKWYALASEINQDNYKNISTEKFFNCLDYCFYTMGMETGELEKFGKYFDMVESFSRAESYINLMVDVDNSYSSAFPEYIKLIRHKYPKITLAAGSVCTPDMCKELILAGADIIKVGFGTRFSFEVMKRSGIGRPQFSAVIDCADACHSLDAGIIANGNISCFGDIAKAFCANADFVMGETLSKETFFSDSVEQGIKDLHDGLRSACMYIGVKDIKYMGKAGRFVRVNRQSNI
jgi:GMP reductase